MLLCICLFLHAAANWLFLYVIAYVVSSKYLCSFFLVFSSLYFFPCCLRVFLGVADNALFFPCCDVYVVFSVLVFRSVAVHVFFVKLLQNSRFLEVIVCGLCFLCCC